MLKATYQECQQSNAKLSPGRTVEVGEYVLIFLLFNILSLFIINCPAGSRHDPPSREIRRVENLLGIIAKTEVKTNATITRFSSAE